MQDKENAPINLVHRLDDRATHGKAGKQAHAHAQPKVSSKRSGGSFGRLLSEATTELRTSSDFKVDFPNNLIQTDSFGFVHSIYSP
jgi:hypothetical protein